LFWIAFAVLAYTYVGFPLLIYLRGKLFPRPYATGDSLPSVSLIIAAYNEQDNIQRKLENVAQLEYPDDRWEVLIASDGSTDRTEEIVRACGNPRVRLLSLPRQGKAAALNCAVEQAKGEILVFSDANSMWESRALRALVAPLFDASVGGVAGDQRYIKAKARSVTDQGERSYWGMDRWLKVYESRAGNVIAATGAIYAIRRALFLPVPEGVTDDFATSTAVILQGARLVFAPDAVAWEHVAERSAQEFGRKTRYGFYSLQLASHKLLRRLMVFPLLMLLVTSILLASSHPFYLAVAVAQVAFYGLALVGPVLAKMSIGRRKIVSLPTYFVMVNTACLVAVWRTLTGNRVVLWEPTRAGNTKGHSSATSQVGEHHGAY
jgi:cellulose synthase/poly-beta-1,6-N-acetylglucosamine synthase-like glycosyltransferase